jgi:NAD(P)-dependent dehydrogenase (short-subunit alcohol dehydrogenase family)
MAVSLEGQVALVTGAGRGLGRAYALDLAKHGAKVVVNDFGGAVSGEGADETPAQQVVKEIQDMGGEAVANGGDVGDHEQCYEMVKQAMDAWGRLDAVVCNAGILRDLALHNMTEQDWDMVLRVHLKQCYNILHHAWPVFRQQAYGRVVMATSAAGLVGNFGQANYGAAKAGMFGLMHVAKIEGAKYNVMVNLISPIAITRMTEGLMGGDTMEEQRRQSMAPEHVAPAVTFMASPRCTQSGMVMEAGGGSYATSFMVRTAGVAFDPNEPKDADWIESHLDELTNMDGANVLWGIGETREDHYAK